MNAESVARIACELPLGSELADGIEAALANPGTRVLLIEFYSRPDSEGIEVAPNRQSWLSLVEIRSDAGRRRHPKIASALRHRTGGANVIAGRESCSGGGPGPGLDRVDAS